MRSKRGNGGGRLDDEKKRISKAKALVEQLSVTFSQKPVCE